jgi:uncharacterized protein YlxW (UPF0749 family)
MEIALLVELILKALIPLILKECFTLATTSIENFRNTDKQDPEVLSSVEALVYLNESLKSENEFQKKEIENLRNNLESVQSKQSLQKLPEQQ